MLPRHAGHSALFLLVVACSSAIPELRPETMHRPSLPGVVPRAVRLLVSDRRDPAPEEGEETVARVREAIAGTLKRAGVEPRQDSTNELSVSFAYPERAMEGFAREDCIQVTARLNQASRGFAQVAATRCFQWRHLLGFSLGGDPSKTFQTAIDDTLQQLDAQLAVLPPPP